MWRNNLNLHSKKWNTFQYNISVMCSLHAIKMSMSKFDILQMLLVYYAMKFVCSHMSIGNLECRNSTDKCNGFVLFTEYRAHNEYLDRSIMILAKTQPQ